MCAKKKRKLKLLRLMTKDRYAKYLSYGGVEYFKDLLIRGETNFTKISKLLGFSVECIRRDFIDYLGFEGYRNIKQKSIFLIGRSMHCTSLEAYVNAIDSMINKECDLFNGFCKDKSLLLDRLNVCKILSRNIRSNFSVKHSKRNQFELIGNNTNILIKYARVKESIADFKTNYYRFNLSGENKKKYNVIVFFLLYKNKMNPYIIEETHFRFIKSLALPFKDVRGKYSVFYQRWDLINSIEADIKDAEY